MCFSLFGATFVALAPSHQPFLLKAPHRYLKLVYWLTIRVDSLSSSENHFKMAKSKKSLKPKKLTSFPMFKKLVPELREMIWGFVPEANTVKISLYKIEEYDSKGELFFLETMDARYTVPAILHTCQESRGVAQKFYQKIFELKFRDRPVWFNTSRDILHLCNTGTLRGIGIRRLNGQGDNKEWHEHNNDPDDDEEFIIHAFDHPIPQIRRLQLGWDLDADLLSSMKQILVAFGKPELLILHKRNDRRKFRNENFSRLKQEVEAYWGNGGDGNDDYKPELHVLTKYQLERMIVSLLLSA